MALFHSYYDSPLGRILLLSDGKALTGLSFVDTLFPFREIGLSAEAPVFVLTRTWLDLYFAGERPLFTPPVDADCTPFQFEVWSLLSQIPYGQTATYGELAEALSTSPRAVGQAVGKNPIALIVPCHRVVGKHGEAVGYAWGTDRKEALLKLERGEGLPEA